MTQIIDNYFPKLQDLLFSEKWPQAIDPFFICSVDSESDKMGRAESILDLMVEESLNGKKFLDFGCGEGHVAHAANKQQPILSVGYDITNTSNSAFNWEVLSEETLLTTSIERVREHAPFDVILLYDVIDHSPQSSLPTLLKEVLSLCKPGARIYLRCHPWTSRHGGHLYQKINKAFVHLVFNQDELSQLGISDEIEAKFIQQNPLKYYRTYLKPERMQWFPFVRLRYQPKAWMHGILTNIYRNCFQDQSLLGILNALTARGVKYSTRRVHRVPVDQFFFEQKLIMNRIKKRVGYSPYSFAVHKLLEQSFVDYVIKLP